MRDDHILANLAADAAEDNKSGRFGLCTCFWRRDIDFQPPSGGLDIGVCASELPATDGTVLLRETGDDASYAEGWLRLAGTDQGPFMALELQTENGIGRGGYWVRAGNHFAYAVGRPTDMQAAASLHCVAATCIVKDNVGKSLADITASMDDQGAALDTVAAYVCVVGKIDAATGQWRILHSTNAELVGCLLVGSEDALGCSHLVFDADSTGLVGQTVDQVLVASGSKRANVTRRWKILEATDCSLPNASP